MADPAKYRTRDETQRMRDQRDAIDHVRKLLLDRGHADEDGLRAIDKEIKNVVNAAADFARESPEPDASELMTDILAEMR